MVAGAFMVALVREGDCSNMCLPITLFAEDFCAFAVTAAATALPVVVWFGAERRESVAVELFALVADVADVGAVVKFVVPLAVAGMDCVERGSELLQ